MKKTKIFLVLVAILLIPAVNASDPEEIATLNYLETSPEILYGDVTLSFNWSERDNHSDIIPVKLDYNSTFDYTFYLFESMNISSTVGSSFVNDTKAYHYTSGGNDYVIYVDYQDFRSPLWELEQLINELNNEILNLQLEIDVLVSQNAYNHSLAETLNSELQGKRQALEIKTSEYNTLSGQVAIIEEARDSAISDYNETLSLYNSTLYSKNSLEWDLYYKNLSIESLTNPFSITYPKQGIDVVQFNATWFFLGIGLALGCVVLFSKRQNWDNMRKGSILQKLPFTRIVPKKSEEWDMYENPAEELSDVEKSHLKMQSTSSDKVTLDEGGVFQPNTGKSLESSMEKIKEQKSAESPPDEIETPPESTEPPIEPSDKSDSDDAAAASIKKYWNSPKGIKRKKEMSEQAK